MTEVTAKPRLPRGLIPTPRHELAAATPFVHDSAKMTAPPPSFLMWPARMAMWGNAAFGDCVTAEEAFAKATANPQEFFSTAEVVAWARTHGFLNGAVLTQVMKTMATQGFTRPSGAVYDDGPYSAVDWTNATNLQSAIFNYGPVKIGVGADDFQSNANGQVTPGVSGWAMCGYPSGLAEDHCVSLCGYGTLSELVSLFAAQGVTVEAPAGMPTGLCYALFTWDSIGIIDEASLLAMTYEAWVRNPVTVAAA